MVNLWNYMILIAFLIVGRLYLKQTNNSNILLIMIWHFGYAFSFFLRWSWINLGPSFLCLWSMIIILNIEFGWFFHSIVLDLISLCSKSLQFFHLSWALIVFHSDMMAKLPHRMCLLNASCTKYYLTSHTEFVGLRFLKASLTLLNRFVLFPISFGLCFIFVCYITEVDRIMIELSLAFWVMLRSVTNLARKFETTSIAHDVTYLMARRALMLFLLLLFGSLDQATFFFGVIGRIFGLVMSIHIRKY